MPFSLSASFSQPLFTIFHVLVSGLPESSVLVSSERLNEVPLLQPNGKPAGIAILVSQKGGLAADDETMTKLLLDRNFLVLTVDLEKWRKELDQDTGDCTYFVSDLEGVAKEAQRMISVDAYMHPVVIGIGEGGVMSYASVADAPAATLAGAVLVDPISRPEDQIALL